MARVPNRHGGGACTNRNGLRFEQITSLDDALESVGFLLKDCEVYDGSKLIGYSVQKHKLYSKFLSPEGINYKDYNSKQWLPDECFINLQTHTAFIIEKKFQNSSGSVDEKLPGCHFKKIEYEKLFKPLGYQVAYLYVFNDWFRAPSYRDVLVYIEEMGCHYYWNEIPLEVLGLI